jgi:tRNA threonylcarbamoyladenosine biosynthesis protein TsaE
MKQQTFVVRQVEDWKAVARNVAAQLQPGMIVTLSGPLGAGKTTFVQYLAKELGTKSVPRSPTFSLVRSYRLPVTDYPLRRLLHVDAYRIEDEKDLLPLNLDEELRELGTVMVIEWPENMTTWLKRQRMLQLALVIDPQPNGSRHVLCG